MHHLVRVETLSLLEQLNQTHVAFTYAGKIRLVPRSGGAAKRITNTPNEESHQVFSPDGKRIAFSRSNGNDPDVNGWKIRGVYRKLRRWSMGVLVVKQEGDELWATAPNSERIELAPEAAADRFIAQPVGAAVLFERDVAGKIVSITVRLPGGREVKGKKL